jgi:hypothetical protein
MKYVEHIYGISEQIEDLVEAVRQLLEDMGPDGLSVCLAVKAEARVALEPFLSKGDGKNMITFARAHAIMEEAASE